ncbi:lipopolysaccharide biosynthesis protein [Xanthobacter autotrophicus]|uniref:GumC family protein n=1 Tax=Xanthobacter TaxID=279 RepID=UPI001E630DEC|nr:lipopolysaccharide biosynthesis protein [Xanthobacter autotrophicus]UDQ90867.1 lipopolysaccharide biosynthesis protein [Xanthobacter autotrophicus]
MAEGSDTPAPPETGKVSSFTLRDFLIAAFFHIRIVSIAAILPLIIAIGAAFTSRTEYTANSLLLVIVTREVSNAQNVTNSGPPVMTIEGLKQVESEVQILESADVARATIEQIGIDRLYPPGRLSAITDLLGFGEDRMDKAVTRFQGSLRASVLSGSNVIQVSFTNPDRTIAVETTDALVRNYLAYRRKVLENPTAKILQLEVERFRRDLATVDKDIEDLKAKAGIIDFSQDAVLAANQVDSILQRRRQVSEREVAVKAQIDEADRQLKALPDSVFDFAETTNALPGDEDANTLTKLLLSRDRLAAQYAPGSQLLREIDKQIATVRQRINARQDRRYSTDRAVRNPQVNYIQNMILSLRVEQDSLARQKGELVDQQRMAEERLTVLRNAETPLIELNRRRDALSEGFREYQRRAVAANIEETAALSRQSAVRVVQEAGAAVVKRSLVLPLLAAGIFAGLLFGGAAGAMASALRTSFITPGEAERGLGLQAIATVDAETEESDGFGTETAISSCATLLLDTRIDDEPLRAIHFLSPDTDDSLTTFTRMLAEELARQRQKRTLLIDLANPTPYPLAAGFTETRGGISVTGTPVPNLWAAADLEASPLLDIRQPIAESEMMMADLKTAFDFVIVCSNLKGASLVTQRFCQLVDGNILAVQAEATRQPAALHLRDSVVESGGVLLGLVFLGRRYYLPHWLYRRA